MKRRALVSVSDKRGVEDFARRLSGMGFEIISTGGTARALSEAGVQVVPVSEVTGAPEILGGGSRRCTPKSTAASSPISKTPTTYSSSSSRTSAR